jgi:hypothetical protein
MPLTRHLYREDEVVAALMFCILRKRFVEAAFWCSELLDSGLVDELIEVLKRIWLYGFGVKALSWLRAFHAATSGDSIDPEQILRLIGGLREPDRSIITLLAEPITEQPDRVNACDVSPKFTTALEAFVARAILQRKSRAAWGGLRGMEDPDGFLLKIAMAKHGVAGCKCVKTIQEVSLGGPWEKRAAAVAALSLDRAAFTVSWTRVADPPLLSEVARELDAWTAALGRRARRIYPIPGECLHWLTRRGRELTAYDTNEKEIMGRLEKSAALWGSGFWDSAAEEFGGWAAIKQEAESREAFYATHFPDDIPDEWSSADRRKSHDRGVLHKGQKADASRAIQTLFARLPTATIWGPLLPVKNVETWAELWSDIGPIDVTGWKLTPVIRRLVVDAPARQEVSA